MKKSQKIISSYNLVKAANYVNEFGQPIPYNEGPGMMDYVGNGLSAYQGGQAVTHGLNVARTTTGLANPGIRAVASPAVSHFSGLGPTAGTFSKVMGRAFTPLAVAGAGYGVYNAAGNMGAGYRQSGFAKAPGGGLGAYTFGSTEGRNRLADTVQGGSLTLAGAGIGAAVGALPGAIAGAAIGGVAELGMGAYRKATGWDGAKFDAAKNLHRGNMQEEDAAGLVYDAVKTPNQPKMFESNTLFGKRDLGAEAFKDVQKESEFLKNKNNAFQSNIS